jgi:type VI secretion system protein VasJ
MDLLDLGKQPTSTSPPTGVDARYDPQFEELQAEIDKLSSPIAVSTMDWNKVLKLASEILAQKSKDLMAASYLAVALIHIRKLDGLAVGLRVWADLLETYWENLFPPKKRMRGRVGALTWWVERTEAVLSGLKVEPVPADKLQALTDPLAKIDDLLRQYLDEPPSLRGIREFVNTIPAISQEPAQAAAPAPAAPAVDAPPTAAAPPKAPTPPPPAAAVAGEITSGKDVQQVATAALQGLRRAAAYLLENEPASPQCYRWQRFAVWSAIPALPPATDGKTRIPPPPAQNVTIVKDLRAKGDWQALLRAAEGRLTQFVLWLDLNRLVAEALGNLGDQHGAAHQVVCQETAFLIQRLPGLETLSFADGTPLADGDTRKWLAGIALGSGGTSAPSAPSTAGVAGESDRVTEGLQKAQALARDKKLVEAVELLQQQAQGSRSQRERLLWRLALTDFLINFKKAGFALPHLEQILQDLELYRLEEWDPELALRALRAVWVGFSNQSDQTARNSATAVLNRIARLSPAEALRLGKG